MTLVSFHHYKPPARYDGEPWTGARIEEAAEHMGPWTAIETKTLTADIDPALPSSRSFTTDLATLPNGWYRIVWLDADGDESAPTTAFHNTGFTPSVDDVAALLRARTYSGGSEVGTFDETTRPTAAQVIDLIEIAAGDLLGRLAGRVPEAFYADARRLIALQAAALIEASFFPDQLDTDRSAYRQYLAMYLSGLEALLARPEISAAAGAGGSRSARVTSSIVSALSSE